MAFTTDDLLALYKQYQDKFGSEAHRYVSQVLAEAKPRHKNAFTGEDHEQSWRAFKGNSLEKLIIYIIHDEIHKLGLEIINGNQIGRADESNLPDNLVTVKRNLLIDYGEYGYHLPDADMVIYRQDTGDIVAVLSSKVTLRERIAQSAYWKLKLLSQKRTKHIKVYFVTLDEDGVFSDSKWIKKSRAIAEKDLDGSYALSESDIKVSGKIKPFSHFIDDMRHLLSSTQA